jgi:capsid protein
LIARAAITRLRTNVVGTGLVCRAQIDHVALGLTEEEGEALNGQLDRLWSLYADNPQECDAEATLNHYQLQALVLMSSMVCGDVFVASPDAERSGCVFSTRLQVIESDRVCNPSGQMDREHLVEGVEFDKLGAPVAYHICTGYQNEYTSGQALRWERLPAFGR